MPHPHAADDPPPLDKLSPPFTVTGNADAFWITDAAGQRFGFTYYADAAIVGTDRSGRLSKRLAERTVRWIAKVMNEAAK